MFLKNISLHIEMYAKTMRNHICEIKPVIRLRQYFGEPFGEICFSIRGWDFRKNYCKPSFLIICMILFKFLCLLSDAFLEKVLLSICCSRCRYYIFIIHKRNKSVATRLDNFFAFFYIFRFTLIQFEKARDALMSFSLTAAVTSIPIPFSQS